MATKKEETEYMEYLSETVGVDNYGLLMYKGDPIQFQVGLNEWLRENGE
jgi:hypothetical protein